MDQKTFNKMWNKAYWRWVGIYTAISCAISVLAFGGIWLYSKISLLRKDDEEKVDHDFLD